MRSGGRKVPRLPTLPIIKEFMLMKNRLSYSVYERILANHAKSGAFAAPKDDFSLFKPVEMAQMTFHQHTNGQESDEIPKLSENSSSSIPAVNHDDAQSPAESNMVVL